MTGFDEYEYALRMRDTIQEMVRKEVAALFPGDRYGEVKSINRVDRVCDVEFPEGGDAVPVQMGSIQPMHVGQTVRVSGKTGDRYISDVMGPSLYDNGWGEGFNPTPIRWVHQVTGGGNVSSTNWQTVAQNLAAYFGGYNQSSGAQNAQVTSRVLLEPGQYFPVIYGLKTNGSGICTMNINGVLHGTVDFYNASNVSFVAGYPFLNWSVGGYADIQLIMATKHASSSGYLGLLSALGLVYIGPPTL